MELCNLELNLGGGHEPVILILSNRTCELT